MNAITTLSRRGLLKSGGALVVSFAFGSGSSFRANAQNAPPQGGRGGPAAPADLDGFLAIHADGTVTIYTSHVDVGTGLNTVYRQIAAEELGIPVERFNVVEGDTSITPDHGGTGGSSGTPRGGLDIRRAAATARLALLGMGAAKLNVPASSLTINDGQVRVVNDMNTSVTVESLIGGKRFDIKVDANATLRNPLEYTVIGKPILRPDLITKATGSHVYIQDFAVPGMLFARVIRPPSPGATLLTVDQSSIATIPNVRVIRIESFLGVVAKDEWAAVRAARELKTTWKESAVLGESDGLDRTMRSTPAQREQVALNRGDVNSALHAGAKLLTATYYWPFHSHASLGPSCCVADVRDTGTTVWSSTQDTFGLRSLLGRTFGLPQDQIHVIYKDGSGSYGSNGAYDAAADAVLLSRAVGAPVRLQWSRADEHVWDPKGPAQLLEVRGALDGGGNLVAWESITTGTVGPQWTGMLLGPRAAGITADPAPGGGAPVTQNLDPPYAVANLRVTARQLPDIPIRLSNLRAPGKIATVFAVESFMDELAHAAGIDPIAFRRRGLSDARALAVIDRVASMMDWQPRTSPSSQKATGPLIGRGFAYMRYKQMENYVAMGMEVAVDRATGKITVRRVSCAHDCGLIVNPDGLRNQVEGNIIQTLSRSLHEEVTFDRSHVTSTDWTKYPILSFPEAPAVEVALINHPDQPAYGAGEAAAAPVAAALANAVFDATGIRLRNVPFTAARVKASLGKV